MFKKFSYLIIASVAAYIAMIHVGQAMDSEDLPQRSESGLSHISLATDDSKDYLNKLHATKGLLQEKIERHREKFTKHIPNRRAMKKILKHRPQGRYNYRCGLHLLKELAKVEKEIAFTLKSREEEALIENYDFLNNLQSGINLFYEQSAESLTQALHKQKIARSRYTTEIKHPWLWGWIAFSITMQTFTAPVWAQLQQAQSNTDIHISPEKFICPRFLMNGTHTALLDHAPAILRAPQASSPFVYATPHLAANAKAMKDTIHCYWDQKSAQKKESRSHYNCTKDVFNQMPDYGNLDIWKEWYDDVQFLPAGRSKDVLTAVTRQEREKIPANTKIIILASGGYPLDMTNYCEHLSILSNFKGKPVVGYYAEFFSAYFGDKSSTIPIGRSRRMLYNEVEYVNKNMSFYDLEDNFAEYIPDNIVFEQDLGEWASAKIAAISHGDSGARHNLIANVDYYRAYHIGQDTYLFKPGLMPKLIDIDTLNTNQKSPGLYSSKFKGSSKLSPHAKKAVDEMGEKGIFTVFSQYFAKYKVSETNPMPLRNVKSFYVPEEHLDNM